MNRILITVQGCYYFLLPENTSGEVLAALFSATPVDSHGYGADQTFTPAPDNKLTIEALGNRKFISDETAALRVQLEEAKKEAAANSQNFYRQYQRTQELEKQLKGAAAPQPSAVAPASAAADGADLPF